KYKKNIETIKSINLDEMTQTNDLEKSQDKNAPKKINSLISKDLVMCPEEDFEQDSEYCLTCRNYKKCLDRNLKISN
nr:hypothetical protein [Spirochaetota bacterium]